MADGRRRREPSGLRRLLIILGIWIGALIVLRIYLGFKMRDLTEVSALADEGEAAALRLLWPSWPWGGGGTEPTEQKDYAFAKGAGSTFWMYGDVLGEYPYQCRCDAQVQKEWLQGTILNKKDDWSPVPCQGEASSSILPSHPKCDPSNQRPTGWTGPDSKR